MIQMRKSLLKSKDIVFFWRDVIIYKKLGVITLINNLKLWEFGLLV